MKITSLENLPGMAIFIDFKKAFDSVNWDFLAKVLETFNFGLHIRKWINVLYTDTPRISFLCKGESDKAAHCLVSFLSSVQKS